MLFRLFHFVFETLASTVSGCSEAGYGQICGQKPLPDKTGNGFVCVIVAYSAALFKYNLFKICTAINKEEHYTCQPSSVHP